MARRILLLSIFLTLSIPFVIHAQYVEWVRRYNGPVNPYYNSDEPTAIAVDAQGNVYVTGSSVNHYVPPYYYNYDWLTIKYYSNGDTAWVRSYNGPANYDDYAYALAIDNAGNVYVTGSSYSSDSTFQDWLTIKYNQNGDIVWAKKFNGTANNYDEARAIAVDNSGNVYVTGYTYNSSSLNDYTIIKYYSNGDTAWVRYYNAPFNSTDEACAIAVDNSGNVYVTGKSYDSDYWSDIATVKYNSSGVRQWVRVYTYSGNNNDEARAITVDNSGNVYVTGLSMEPDAYWGGDCITIKYLSNGDTAWVRRYNGTANDWDEGKDIAIDNQGNVYVTGLTSVPGQYGPQVNYLTIKYNSTGNQEWLRRYNRPDSTDCYNIASAIALDSAGNIYVTGQSQGSNYYDDFATIKYSPAGIEKWVVRYNGPVNEHDEATAITVDLAGNVYVTGKSEEFDYDYATIKYYQAGANDVGVDSIIYPPAQHLRLMSMKPCALVRNFGTSPQTNFPVVCSIIGSDNSVRYTSTKIISYLADYDTIRVYFDTWTPTITETCVVKMRTNLSGDQDPHNDRKTRITEITNAVLFLSEGFNIPIFPPHGWQSVIVQGGYEWQCRTYNTNPTCSPYEGLAMASYQSYNASYGSKARLISPPIYLGTQPKTCLLNFAMYHDPGSPSAPDSIKIEYSTDGINFTQVAAFSRYQQYSHWEEHSVELGTFNGTIYFGILAFSGYGRNMNIDLVQLYGTLPLFNDVAVDEIISPLSNQQGGLPIIPTARIKNYGLNAQSNFPVVCSIISPSGLLRYTNTQNVPFLASGDTICVNFASWIPNVEEVCLVKIRTLLANDENPSNNQKTKQTDISSAQIFLSEGFNDIIFPPPGWQSVIISGNVNWERKTSNVDPPCPPYEGLGMASYQSYYAYEGSMARLISPPITLGTAPIPCTLKFFMYHDPDYQYNPDSVKIEYSTDGTNFTRVTAFSRYSPTQGWTQHSVYLGTLSGTIYVGFLAYSGYGNNMNIDYVRMTKRPQYANDVGVDAIIQPTLTHTINSEMTPIARIRNFGTATQTNFSVTCSIFGISSELLGKIQDTKQLLTADFLSLLSNADCVVRYIDTVRITSLAAGETTRANFRAWTPTIIEPCIVRIRTNLNNDQNPYNNLKDRITEISAIQILLCEGFNNTTFPPLGWQSNIIQGSYNWERKTSNEYPTCLPYEGEAMASYPSYDASQGSMARLISPPITLGTSPLPCSLKFFMYHDPGYSDCPDSVKIEYSTDGINFTRRTAFRRYASASGWTEHQVYLGTFSGTIYLGILAFSGYGNNMNIDNVCLYHKIPLANDVGVSRIISPGICQIPNTLMPITAWIKNYGNNPQTNFPVICSVIGPAKVVRYTNTVYVTTILAPHDSLQVNVGSYTPTISEMCSLIVRTNLANDQNPDNDRKIQLTNINTYFSLLSEGFNNITFPPFGWQSVIVNGDYNWQRKSYNENPTCYPYEGSGMASYPCWDAYTGENARLISPLLNFSTVPISCSLKFNMYHDTGYSDCYDLVRIEYSTDGINFNPVDSFLRYQAGPPSWTEHSIALGSFTGTFWLGIVGYSDYGNNINIDNVRLTGRTIANDVGVDAIISPSSQHSLNTPMIPIARVKNYGSVSQNNFQVICSIVGTGTDKISGDLKDNLKANLEDNPLTDIIRYVDTLRISSLAPNETTRVSFRAWIPTAVERCTIKIRTKLTNDQNPLNDRKSVITDIISAAIIISPNGGEIWAGGSNKTIRWQAPQIYTRYVLLLSTNSGATYPDTIANNLLPTDSTYLWQVPMLNFRTCRVKLAIFDNLGNLVAQDASDADFTIDSQAPSIPLLIAPANNTYIRDSMPRFIWHKSTDAENKHQDRLFTLKDANLEQNLGLAKEAFELTDYLLIRGIAQYQLQYATNSNFTGAIQINTADTFYQVPSRLIDTTYYWRVKAIDSAGNQSNWSAVWRFEIDTRAPNAPVLIYPINGIWLTNTNVIFQWSQVTFNDHNKNIIKHLNNEASITDFSSQATKDKPDFEFASPIRYFLQVDTNRNFTGPITDTTPYLYDTLTLSQAKYFWRVKAYDLAGNQGAFFVDSFGIDYTAPSVPILIYPPNGATLNNPNVTFIWRRASDNLSGVSHYTLQGAIDPFFIISYDTIVTDTTFNITLIDTTFYWRVRSHDRAANQSNWSSTRSFTIRTMDIYEPSNNQLRLITKLINPKPNPIYNHLTQISFMLAKPSYTTLQIYNISGKLIKTLIKEYKQAGTYNLIWDCTDQLNQKVSKGIYFCTLKSEDYCETKKLILTR